MSSSLPNAVLSNNWSNNVEERKLLDHRSSSFSNLNNLQINGRDGSMHYCHNSGSRTSQEFLARPLTPKFRGHIALESLEYFEEEPILPDEDENSFLSAPVDSKSMKLHQDSIPANYNSTFDSSEVVNDVSAPGKPNGAMVSRSHGDANLHDNRKLDTGPTHIARKDLFDIFMPLKTTLHERPNREEEEVCLLLRQCLELREKYVYRENAAPWMKETVLESNFSMVNNDPFHYDPVEPTEHYFRMEEGVVHVYSNKNATEDLFPVASSTEFFTDMHHLLRISSLGDVRSACHHRLRLLEEKYRLHLLVNADREFLYQKGAPHRDFYNVRKVDTHIHHSACMNQKHLLRFIKSKLRKEPDEVVIFRDGKYLTLKEVFASLDLTGYDLNVDLLDVHADKNTFHRFDKFNLKYNPCGQSRLREIFLKQDNLIQGRFLAEVTKEVLSDLDTSKYQMAEYRVSIYGRKQSEWDQLASWFINNGIYSENAIWLIQLPRLYNVYRKMGTATSFQNILDNVFIPLFEVTVDPSSHPQLHVFLKQVVGLDIVDDESKPERRPTKHMPNPSEWTNEFNPAYSYYAYYCYANLYTLNKLRESKGMSTIRFRPHCGEAGEIDHLASSFLICHNIAHGINLRKSPVLQYLYYLAQIGLAMTPLSNNSLFVDYHKNPFPTFFQRGLNVSLSTDDPLLIHLTKEPLVEEYSVAAQVWKLTSCDICEIARNSVYQSGFSHSVKLHWLGNKYYKRGPEGNDIHKTNVPSLRIAFRHETWKEEMQYVYLGKAEFPEDIDH
ncbi:Amp deaminase [Thalictrum thalictroides]|uniref:AMP deaminase n=1 Tax=Thalictrum thalictroides TaxID=46969 RepID=A0A7J6XB56_THATH|nr:Amp deaminase [Thalictrum thalictroides]